MDDDDHRRGRLTCHKVYGEGIAILAGNGLMAHAFQLLTEIPGGAGFSLTKIEVLNGLCRAIGTQRGVIAGQVVDLVTEGKPFSPRELEYIHSSKTGALIEASVFCSAVLARAEEQYLRCLKSFGMKVGLAFQIVDDILDMEGSQEELGKTPGKDLVEQKATYPALYGVKKSREAAHSLIEEAIAAIGCLRDKGEALRELAHFISIRRF
jgi:geranylgeranyl diphosphate synthase type II